MSYFSTYFLWLSNIIRCSKSSINIKYAMMIVYYALVPYVSLSRTFTKNPSQRRIKVLNKRDGLNIYFSGTSMSSEITSSFVNKIMLL